MQVIIVNSQHDEIIPDESIEYGSIADHYYNRLVIKTISNITGECFYYRYLTDISIPELSKNGYLYTIKFILPGYREATFAIDSQKEVYNFLKIKLVKNIKIEAIKTTGSVNLSHQYSAKSSISSTEKKNIRGCTGCRKAKA